MYIRSGLCPNRRPFGGARQMGVSINQNGRSRAQLQIPKYELITSGGDPIHGHNFSIFMNYICHVAVTVQDRSRDSMQEPETIYTRASRDDSGSRADSLGSAPLKPLPPPTHITCYYQTHCICAPVNREFVVCHGMFLLSKFHDA